MSLACNQYNNQLAGEKKATQGGKDKKEPPKTEKAQLVAACAPQTRQSRIVDYWRGFSISPIRPLFFLFLPPTIGTTTPRPTFTQVDSSRPPSLPLIACAAHNAQWPAEEPSPVVFSVPAARHDARSVHLATKEESSSAATLSHRSLIRRSARSLPFFFAEEKADPSTLDTTRLSILIIHNLIPPATVTRVHHSILLLVTNHSQNVKGTINTARPST